MAGNVPDIAPEKNRSYAKGSPERVQLQAALEGLKRSFPVAIPNRWSGDNAATISTVSPAAHANVVATSTAPSAAGIRDAVAAALAAREPWSQLSFQHRAAVVLRAADLLAAKHRLKVTAALITSQGMDVRQAEVSVGDAIDYLRFNVQNAERLYREQPGHNAPGIWNSVEYPALEGFVLVKSSPHSLAETVNPLSAAVLMGNAVVWMPATASILSNHLLMDAFADAGIPDGIIQFIPGATASKMKRVSSHASLAAVVFSGHLQSLLELQLHLATQALAGVYKTFPRLIADATGNSFHLVHPHCDLEKAVSNTARSAFEYQGQKGSSASSLYVPASRWDDFKTRLTSSTERLGVGSTESWRNFVGPVIDRDAFDRLAQIIKAAEADEDLELISGGKMDDSEGYFIHPTIYATRNTAHRLLTLKEPLQGPILVVCIYDDQSSSVTEAWLSVCKTIKSTVVSCRSAAVFAQNRHDLIVSDMLKPMVGHFCINTRCNAASVAQQAWGGGRLAGGGEKLGSVSYLQRFVQTCSVKEELLGGYHIIYASHVE